MTVRHWVWLTARVLGALSLLAVGAVHLQQYDDLYSAIPTIGTLFVLNFVAATLLGVGLLVPFELLWRRGRAWIEATLALGVSGSPRWPTCSCSSPSAGRCSGSWSRATTRTPFSPRRSARSQRSRCSARTWSSATSPSGFGAGGPQCVPHRHRRPKHETGVCARRYRICR